MTQIVQALPSPTYDVALARSNAVKVLVDFAASYREQISYRTGVAGNGMGTLDVPSTNRRIYVQLGAVGG